MKIVMVKTQYRDKIGQATKELVNHAKEFYFTHRNQGEVFSKGEHSNIVRSTCLWWLILIVNLIRL
jgi:hypothetical protein